MKGRVVSVVNASKRSGQSNKNGKTFDWNIAEVEVEKEDGSLVHADTFDTVVDGDIVELTPNSYTNPNTGKTYDGWNCSLPKQNYGQKSAVDFTEVLTAIRMVYRELKEVKADIKLLKGDEPEQPSQPAPEEPRPAQKAPSRDWTSVGKQEPAPDWVPSEREVDDAPTYEPIPEEPADINDFMNQ